MVWAVAAADIMDLGLYSVVLRDACGGCSVESRRRKRFGLGMPYLFNGKSVP